MSHYMMTLQVLNFVDAKSSNPPRCHPGALYADICIRVETYRASRACIEEVLELCRKLTGGS